MTDPMSHLTEDDRQLVLTLLERVVGQPQDYVNQVTHLSGDGKVTYYVQVRDDRHPQGAAIVHDTNIAPMLERLALVVQGPSPSPRINRRTGVVRQRESERFQFTPLAIEAYKRLQNVDDAEVRRRIGKYLFDQYQEQGDESVPFDTGAIAEVIKVDRKRVVTQARLLRDTGLLEEDGPINSSLEFGFISLSKPDGLRWAMQDFPADFAGLQSYVAVDVHINVHHFLATVEELPLDPAQKAEAEELAKDIEQEPTIEKFGRLLGMAANIKELIVPAGQLIAQHADKIPHLV